MAEGSASLTALGTSLMRAVHTRTDPAPLIDDDWGARLVTEAERAQLYSLARQGLDASHLAALDAAAPDEAALAAALRAWPGFANIILRQRYAEDALARAVAGGVAQYVIVGAGLDSFALRRPSFAAGVTVFEVDLPATQDLKRRRIAEIGVAEPAGLVFVAADLGRESLDAALGRTDFRADRSAFFSWLGVTSYLSREANLATLAAIARCATPGSELVFTYIDSAVLDAQRGDGDLSAARQALATSREPWVSGFRPEDLRAVLAGCGFDLVEDLSGGDLVERYCAERADFPSTGEMHVALARRSVTTAGGSA